jgi:uncharacterized protein YukE
MAKVMMILDDTESNYLAFKREAGNVLMHVMMNIDPYCTSDTSWWRGEAAARFFAALQSAAKEVKDVANALPLLYDRIEMELTEWTDVDLAYANAAALKIKLPTGKFDFADPLTWFKGLQMKFSLRDLISAGMPWSLRYPPEKYSETYTGFLGWTWTETSTYGNWDGGAYGGFTTDNDEKPGLLGAYLGGSLDKTKYRTTSLFGIPIEVTTTGPSLEGKLGTDGVNVGASAWKIELNVAGFEVGFDLGLGYCAQKDKFKAGPFSVGYDLGIYDETLNQPPARPEY